MNSKLTWVYYEKSNDTDTYEDLELLIKKCKEAGVGSYEVNRKLIVEITE